MNLTGQYATDFQNILNKAVQTSEVPLSQLQTQDTFVLGHKATLGSLESTVAALTTSLTSLGTLAAGQALSATSSNTAAVTVTNSGATTAATYTINSVTSAAAAASETSLISYADPSATPVSTTGKMDLVIGGVHNTFTLTTNTLSGVMNQINGMGVGVTASILTTGTGTNYLSLQANATGLAALQLNDDPTGANTNILTATNPGTNAVFKLNGIPISQASNTVNNVISGLTFNIIAPTSTAVKMTLASDPSQLTSSLQDLITNYNSLEAAVQAQVGPGGGALLGDPVISQLRAAMHQMTSYQSASGSIHSLADLGVTFNSSNGAATFDQTKINGMSSTQLTDALKFAGSTTTGLGAFSKTFDQFSSPIDGQIQIEVSGDTTTDTHLQAEILKTTTNIQNMQKGLAKQIEAADALESAYESQQATLNGSLQGLYLVMYGKSTGNVA
jgi:flagellar hook-associated protein 2